jgi:hypothetical protein
VRSETRPPALQAPKHLNRRENRGRARPDSRAPDRKEGIIGGRGRVTSAKRDREKSRQEKQREKEAQRAQRKANKRARGSSPDGEDPDLAGLKWGPQPPLY